MARNLIKRVIGASNRLFSNAQDTNWSASFDSLIARWQKYEDEMNYIRESKKLPLRWCPPAGKSKLSPVTLAEDCLLKKLSDKCSANEILANEMYQQPTLGEDNTLQNLYDEVFEEAGRRYREKIRISKKAMKQRLDQEMIPTSSDGPRVQKHSMINPQRLFTPIVKKSSSFTNRKPITYDRKLNKNDTPTINPTVESKSNVSIPTINPTVESKSNISTTTINPTVESKSNISVKDTPINDFNVSEKISDVNLKPMQSVQSQNEPTHPVNTPLVPTHQTTNPLAPVHHMTSNLAPAQHMISPLVPTHPVSGSSERKTFSQQWNFNRMQRVAGNQDGQSNMSAYKRTSQKPKITFIQPKKSQALYRYIGSNIPVTNITGPITSMT